MCISMEWILRVMTYGEIKKTVSVTGAKTFIYKQFIVLVDWLKNDYRFSNEKQNFKFNFPQWLNQIMDRIGGGFGGFGGSGVSMHKILVMVVVVPSVYHLKFKWNWMKREQSSECHYNHFAHHAHTVIFLFLFSIQFC